MGNFFYFKMRFIKKAKNVFYENKHSPDWKGAEGVKKLHFFCGCFLILDYIILWGKNGMQLFYGAAVDGGTLKSRNKLYWVAPYN